MVCEQQWNQRVDPMEMSKAVVTVENTGDIRMGEFTHQSEFIMSIRICQQVWANKAQEEHAFRNGERSLLATLYGEGYQYINGIRSALCSGDRDYAMKLLDQFEAGIGMK
jgi:hypothetical protein